ncbi:2-octaprenyl-6-methoxy-1,4-benzoquinone methylase /demethylmenaquinone methyltransferase [Thermodesulfobium acidiphilum]|uniref:Demethylmenaquinone methyltransferase n=1 Tax=Thermodesulfobium acidiphilum TaxID=1794699 RepID=A0A2R4W1S4_THEAF|nr:ubiquinone/menaquinone biosynthesis methyltransferase [Thermodesulfobium acidiphilum]AWB10745.1 2-octaprenyl-6-methoxy-1,4-benzoquinone methylase /demethylmenaquinone methyltransferase [Thermodesulfobium acidiphilum]
MPKKELVLETFSKISNVYDYMNDFMTLGMHRDWKNLLIKETFKFYKGSDVLDIGSGTGDLVFLVKKRYPDVRVVALDINDNMIKKLRQRIERNNIKNVEIVKSFAEDMPFENESFGAIISSYTVRNLEDIERSFKEIYRITKKPGVFGFLELSEPKIFKNLFWFYLDKILPFFGEKIGCREEYEYLGQSLRAFLSPEKITLLLKRVGFKKVYIAHVCAGVSTIYIAVK